MLTTIDYEAFINLCNQRPYKDLHNAYIVNIKTSEQFFKIITEVLSPNLEEQILFLTQHEKILNENNLYPK